MAQVKRFVLMAGLVYYASGGFEDYISSHDSKDEAETAMKKWLEENPDYTWAHVGDLETGDMFAIGAACNPMGFLR